MPLMVLLAAGPAVAQGQTNPADAVMQRQALASVAKSCAADIERLCPSLSNPSARDEAICLRPLKADLSLGCRHAVSTAFR